MCSANVIILANIYNILNFFSIEHWSGKVQFDIHHEASFSQANTFKCYCSTISKIDVS